MSIEEAKPHNVSMEDVAEDESSEQEVVEDQAIIYEDDRESSLRAHIHQTEAPKKIIEVTNPSDASLESPNDSEKIECIEEHLKQKDESYEPVIQDIVMKSQEEIVEKINEYEEMQLPEEAVPDQVKESIVVEDAPKEIVVEPMT